MRSQGALGAGGSCWRCRPAAAAPALFFLWLTHDLVHPRPCTPAQVLAVKPRKGDAVLFHSIKPSGELERLSLHTAWCAHEGQWGGRRGGLRQPRPT